MRFYKDIIDNGDERARNGKTTYHQWSPQSIQFYWDVCANNPFVRKQFYPIEYWEDLLLWAFDRMTTPLTIVDIGCGNGNLIQSLNQIYRGASIYGVDLSEDSLTPVKERFEKYENVQFRIGALNRIPFENESVDMVTCTEVLEHTFPETFTSSFSEIKRVLKNGGYYLASVPFNEEIALVCCPGCGSIFTPYQHMIFEISYYDIRRLLSENSLELIEFYQSVDRTQPKNPAKRVLKSSLIKWFPGVANRIFPKSGVSGFLARKAAKP